MYALNVYVPPSTPAGWCNDCHRITVQPTRHDCAGGTR